MAEKLNAGMEFPEVQLKLVDGSRVEMPTDITADYAVVLFYRAHWWSFCRRQLADFERMKDELVANSIAVYAASSDTLEHVQEVQRELSFPIAYGVTREHADALGPWWEERCII